VDRLLDLATSAVTQDERRRYYIEAQKIIAVDAPVISLWAGTNVAVASSDLTGVALSPLGDFAFFPELARTAASR
jgi:ABC-type transport system substrate-binding protein